MPLVIFYFKFGWNVNRISTYIPLYHVHQTQESITRFISSEGNFLFVQTDLRNIVSAARILFCSLYCWSVSTVYDRILGHLYFVDFTQDFFSVSWFKYEMGSLNKSHEIVILMWPTIVVPTHYLSPSILPPLRPLAVLQTHTQPRTSTHKTVIPNIYTVFLYSDQRKCIRPAQNILRIN